MEQNLLQMPKVGNNKLPIGSIELGEQLKKRYEENLAAKSALQVRKAENMPAFAITDAELAAANEEFQLQKEMEGERLREQYGAVTDADIYEILKAEKEIALCKDCQGLPCLKKKNRNFTPHITCKTADNRPKVVNSYCDFAKVYFAQKKVEQRLGLSKIPAEYQGKTFEDYRVDANNAYAVKVAKKLIELPNNGAYFYGTVGTGKTFLAAIIAQEVIKQGRTAIFTTIPKLSMQLRSTFGNNAKITEAELLEQLMTVPTLILDDVGMEKPTRFICSTVCNLFNERYNARLQTIMTSNYRLKELENIFNNPTDGGATLDGTRLYDRCKQMCVPVEFKGNSRRA